MDLRIAVDLRGRRGQKTRAVQLGQAERVVGAVRADLERVQGQPQVVDRARRRGEVVDEVNRLLDEEGLRDVLVQEDEVLTAEVLDVRERPGLEVVDTDHAVAAGEERIAQMGAEKAAATGYQTGGHCAAG